jgi:stage II sporulation protein D
VSLATLVLAGHLLGGPIPPPDAQGNALLWSNALGFDRDGMPMIPVGVRRGAKTLSWRAEVPGTLLLGEGANLSPIALRAGQRVTVKRLSGSPGVIGYYLVSEFFPARHRAEAERRLAYWKALGLDRATLVPMGVSVGLAGTGVDSRCLALALDYHHQADVAQRRVGTLHERHNVRSHVTPLLLERPFARLEVRVGRRRFRTENRVGFAPRAGDQRADLELMGRGGSRLYRGHLEVVPDARGALAAVMVTRAEELVAGTVPAESYADAAIEALKAQAIAARTELFSKLGMRHGADPFLLCDDQDCQVYRGAGARHPRTDLATAATRGALLFDTTQANPERSSPLAHAYYSAICGGHTEHNDSAWNQAPSATLRGRPDGSLAPPPINDDAALRRWIEAEHTPWCQRSRFAKPARYRWTKKLAGKSLRKRIGPLNIGALLRLKIEQRGVSGRVIALRLEGTSGTTRIASELAIRRLFGNLNSSLFVVRIQRNAAAEITAVTFDGRGWGHGVGMCQMGAIGLAEAGKTAQEILGHYYGGAQVQRAY